MVQLGYSEKAIYTTLGVSETTWRKAKTKKALKTILNNNKQIKQDLDQLIKIRKSKAPLNKLLKLLDKSVDEDNPNTDKLLKVIRQLYPDENHYLQVEKEKIAIEREKIELEREKIKLLENGTDSKQPPITIVNDLSGLNDNETNKT